MALSHLLLIFCQVSTIFPLEVLALSVILGGAGMNLFFPVVLESGLLKYEHFTFLLHLFNCLLKAVSH